MVCTDPKAAIKTAPNSKANHAFVDRQTKREMVSTGDNNGGTPPAEAMPEAVREAAMKVAAWLNGTASKAEGEGVAEPAAAAYTVPAPEQLTRDVLNALVLGFQQRDNAAHAAPTLTEDHNLQHDDGISRAIATVGYEQLKAAKHAAILNIEAAIARATDPESQAELKELLERVKDAKSSGGLRDVLASASTAVANAISKADSEKIDLQALHKDLYQNDAQYRADIQRISGEADALQKQSQLELGNVHAHAKAQGYTSTVDDEIERLDDKISRTEDQQEKLKLQEIRYRLEAKRLNEYRKQAEERGDKEGIELIDKGIGSNDDSRTKHLLKLKEAQEKLLDAHRRKLEKVSNLSPEALKNELAIMKRDLQRDYDAASQDMLVASTKLQFTEERLTAVEKETRASIPPVVKNLAEAASPQTNVAIANITAEGVGTQALPSNPQNKNVGRSAD